MNTLCTHRCNVYLLSCLQQVEVKCITDCIFVLRQNASLESLKLLFLFFLLFAGILESYLDGLQSEWSLHLSVTLCVKYFSTEQEKKSQSSAIFLVSFKQVSSLTYAKVTPAEWQEYLDKYL